MKNKAFTLIELLVVVAIISLLVSILLPSLSKAKNLAQRAACQSNCHQIGLVVLLYTSDFNGFMVNTWEGSTRAYHELYAACFLKHGVYCGAGTLYQLGYADLPKMFQCPSIPPNGIYSSFDEIPTYGKYFDMNHIDDNEGRWLMSSYMFKAYEPEQIADNLLAALTDRPSYQLFYPNRPLMADVFFSSSSFAPFPRHLDGLNVSYEDGSCQFIEMDTECEYRYHLIRNYFRDVLTR